MAEEKGSPQDFQAVANAADEAEAGFKKNPASLEASPAPEGSLREEYKHQVDLNHEAHRQMRWLAFGSLGAFIGLFLFILLLTLVDLLDRKSVSALLVPIDQSNWHAYIFLGMLVLVFAVVPLSLAMALVKMISINRDGDDSIEYKTPTTELGKVIVELLKSMASAAKSG